RPHVTSEVTVTGDAPGRGTTPSAYVLCFGRSTTSAWPSSPTIYSVPSAVRAASRRASGAQRRQPVNRSSPVPGAVACRTASVPGAVSRNPIAETERYPRVRPSTDSVASPESTTGSNRAPPVPGETCHTPRSVPDKTRIRPVNDGPGGFVGFGAAGP